MQGIDVSSHQGQIDWAAVAASGIGFVFTKATGGAWYENPYYAEQLAGARAAGLAVGSYAYAFESSGQPFPGPGPEAEAQFFLDCVRLQGLNDGDMLVLDIEEGPSDMDVADWALRWLRYVEKAVGFPPLCYTGKWFTDQHGFGRLPALARFPLWLAAYQKKQPPPVAPWDLIAFWQHTDKGSVPGVAGNCDMNVLTPEAGAIALYGCPAGGIVTQPPVEPPVVAVLPSYDWTCPSISQNDNWSCSCTSARWMLTAWDRHPTESWLENSMVSEGVVSPDAGLLDATGQGMADWLNRHYSENGYLAEHDPHVLFEDVMAEAGEHCHPLMIGGRGWYHWSGVRGRLDGTLMLANPAPGWKGINQVLTREQFEYLGPFSMVRLTHPAAEAGVPVEPPRPDDPFEQWRGGIGSGLLEMMAADGTVPAQRRSTWLPLGAPAPSDVEECYGANGVLYYWLITVGKGFRTRPVA